MHQLADATVVVLNLISFDGVERTLPDLRALTSAPILILCPPTGEEVLLDMYNRGATFVAMRPYDLRLLAAQARALSNVAAVAAVIPAPHPLLNPETQSISLPNGDFRLTGLEYRLLAALLDHPGRVFAPDKLVENVWGYSGDGDRSLVKGLVNRVRRKIEPEPRSPSYLVTEPGVGYRFIPPDGASSVAG